MGHLDVATVSYTLPDGRPLLRNVAFSLGTGEQVAVVGANGAGKSTLLRIVMGQLSPDSGIVTCDGNFGVMGQFITAGQSRNCCCQSRHRRSASQPHSSHALKP